MPPYSKFSVQTHIQSVVGDSLSAETETMSNKPLKHSLSE
jgi:hypothetical protein